MQTIYGLIRNGGDGSASMHWVRTEEEANDLLEQEDYFMNEGTPAVTLTFPDDLDLEEAGFNFA